MEGGGLCGGQLPKYVHLELELVLLIENLSQSGSLGRQLTMGINDLVGCAVRNDKRFGLLCLQSHPHRAITNGNPTPRIKKGIYGRPN